MSKDIPRQADLKGMFRNTGRKHWVAIFLYFRGICSKVLKGEVGVGRELDRALSRRLSTPHRETGAGISSFYIQESLIIRIEGRTNHIPTGMSILLDVESSI